MGKRDARIDDYIGKSAAFAKPVLAHLRKLVRQADPDLEETIKWDMPSFTWQGKLVCSLAAFKQHCALNIWRASEIMDKRETGAMGQFGKITDLADLPADSLVQSMVRKRIKSYRDGTAPKRQMKKKPAAQTPDDLADALAQNARAGKTFKGFTDAQRREYIEWITDAKRDATRQKRLATSIEWLAEGKQRNWKYM